MTPVLMVKGLPQAGQDNGIQKARIRYNFLKTKSSYLVKCIY
ncbi:hypothetical protein C8P64_0587 [Christiangramia gaetbulicola]|uniref:Uncharacterized protein n=1 Tax=Christiangramia gaetbulicola TaxID=703340 RepID=A0A2T6ALG9_9FLAO|nr:hypothetical protein C8P64_0587 [Christiangramia gaetbulicola]